MGFDQNSTLYSFLIGVINSLNLMRSDNIIFKNNNQITGKVFLVLFIMKFFEYLMWFDNECKYGINESANIMGSLLDNMIPSIIYFLFTIKKGIFNETLTYINAIYIFYVLFNYLSFLKEDKLCTIVDKNKTIFYGWNDNFNMTIYILILAINIFKFYSETENYVIFIAIFTILLINKMKKGKDFKFLTLFVNFIPLIINQIQNFN
tara:strand:+ start:155 stop:772 length:618 start_codon:yes stop_codon:yes gene_type:complete